jgi:hypothetical protein
VSQSQLYDEDILLWSEQQAELIRKLGRTHSLPVDFDVQNVAEEIESVGRAELAAVKVLIRQMLRHLIKLAAEAGVPAAPKWQGELVGFQFEMRDRYSAISHKAAGTMSDWP